MAGAAATVLGQDLAQRDDGVFAIARAVAEDRVISTVDPEARHGRKTAARGFDGYKGHISIDPDSELIVATDVTAGNVADAAPAAVMLEEALEPGKRESDEAAVEVYGDSSYGAATLVEHIEGAGAEANVKVQPPFTTKGHFAQDAFTIDTDKKTVMCPAGILVELRPRKDGSSTRNSPRAARVAHCVHSAPILRAVVSSRLIPSITSSTDTESVSAIPIGKGAIAPRDTRSSESSLT